MDPQENTQVGTDNPRRSWVVILLGVGVAGVVAGLLICVGLNVPSVPKAKANDAEGIVGRWRLIDVQLGEDGKRPAADDIDWRTAVYEFRKDGTYTSTEKWSKQVDGKYTLDPAASPKALDIIGERIAFAIYELDGNTLMLCVGRSADAKRPMELKAGAKTATDLWTFERVNEKKLEPGTE